MSENTDLEKCEAYYNARFELATYTFRAEREQLRERLERAEAALTQIAYGVKMDPEREYTHIPPAHDIARAYFEEKDGN